MTRSSLLLIGALLELVAGSLLLALPRQTTALLVTDNIAGEGITIAQMLGASLLSMGIMLFFTSKSKDQPIVQGITIAYILYNLAGIGVMLFGSVSRGHDGVMLWPAIATHSVLVVLLFQAYIRERE